ncbi:MAG: class I SAM-dependent methyltransferase, partial [Myxococcota bacterium]
MSYYEGIADYYDLLMDSGYYDHDELAGAIRAAIGPRKKLLELGIGTGQMAEALLRADPTYELCGIDFSPAMIKIAKKRFSNSIPIIECDVAAMSLGRRFDVAVSCGGTWVIVQSDGELLLGTHLFNRENDFRGLRNVADHLEPGGRLLLSVHLPHEDKELELSDGIVYSQRIGERKGGSDHYSVEKTYSFRRDGSLLAEETLTLGFYRETASKGMLADAGFKPLGMTDTK